MTADSLAIHQFSDSGGVSLLVPSLWSGSVLAAGLTVGTLMAL